MGSIRLGMKRWILAPVALFVVALAGCLPAAPAASPTATGASAAAAVPPGRPFSASSSWNTPLSANVTWRDEPALRAGHSWVADEEYSIPIVHSAAGDPLVAVTVPGTWGWPAGTLHLHIPAGVTGAAGTDASIVVVSDNIAYNFWIFARTDATHASAQAYAEANTVTDSGWGTASPFRGAGIRAAGSSGLAGIITSGDLASGNLIHHALSVSLLGTEIRSGFVAPAIADDGGGYSGTIPMGSRLGIPAGTPMPAGLSPIGRTIWNTLITYGAFVVDQHGGNSPMMLTADPDSIPTSTIDPLRIFWNGAPSDLDRIMPAVRVVR